MLHIFPPGYKVNKKKDLKMLVFVKLSRQMSKNEKISEVHLAIIHKWLTHKSSMKN